MSSDRDYLCVDVAYAKALFSDGGGCGTWIEFWVSFMKSR